jgi:alkyl hydroperoxide reductase subunit AhpC
MATLCLELASENASAPELHEWLNGDWALLFSNPEDFQPETRERRRWLDILRVEFDARGLRALAVKRDGPPLRSWIDELQFDREIVQLREPGFVASDAISFAARALRGDLLTQQCSFVVFIDGTLARREILKYSAGRHSISMLDLLASVDALRSRRVTTRTTSLHSQVRLNP